MLFFFVEISDDDDDEENYWSGYIGFDRVRWRRNIDTSFRWMWVGEKVMHKKKWSSEGSLGNGSSRNNTQSKKEKTRRRSRSEIISRLFPLIDKDQLEKLGLIDVEMEKEFNHWNDVLIDGFYWSKTVWREREANVNVCLRREQLENLLS